MSAARSSRSARARPVVLPQAGAALAAASAARRASPAVPQQTAPTTWPVAGACTSRCSSSRAQSPPIRVVASFIMAVLRGVGDGSDGALCGRDRLAIEGDQGTVLVLAEGPQDPGCVEQVIGAPGLCRHLEGGDGCSFAH